MLNRPAGSNADEWHLFLSEHKDALPYVAVQIAEAIEALERQVYVPGLWRCPKCKFQLCQANLYAAAGTVGARDEPGDKCPNCNFSPLWRVTERQAGNDMVDRCVHELERSKRLQAALEHAALYVQVCPPPSGANVELRAALQKRRDHILNAVHGPGRPVPKHGSGP